MSQMGHFVASADVVEEKTRPPLPPPLTRTYESFDQLVDPLADSETGRQGDSEADCSSAANEDSSNAIAPALSEPDQHLRNIMNSFQLAVTPPVVTQATLIAPIVSELLPSFDGPQLKFPLKSGS